MNLRRFRSPADFLVALWIVAIVLAFLIVYFPPAAEHALNGMGATSIVRSIHAIQSWISGYYAISQ